MCFKIIIKFFFSYFLFKSSKSGIFVFCNIL